MKFKAAYTDGVPPGLVKVLESGEFALTLLRQISAECLGAVKPEDRPAEYYVQTPDVTICANGVLGVEMRLTGVNRNGRAASVFHNALKRLDQVVSKAVSAALREAACDIPIQVFAVIMLDDDIETSPGSGVYSSNLESEAHWVKAA